MAKNVNEVVLILRRYRQIEGENRLNRLDAEHQPSTTPSTSSSSLSEAVDTVDQFRQGVATLGLLAEVEKNPARFEKLFTVKTKSLQDL